MSEPAGPSPELPSAADPLLRGGVAERGVRIAWLVLLLSLAGTLLAWFHARNEVEGNLRLRFDAHVRDVADVVEHRMHTYEQVLRGGLGLFRASEAVTAKDWQRYVQSLNVERQYPGILAMGYAPFIQGDELRELEASVSRQSLHGYRIDPPGVREVMVPVLYIEPEHPLNLRARGFDMFTEPLRREALLKACGNGRATITAPLRLKQELDPAAPPGILMYLPVFITDPEDAVEGCRVLPIGFVFGAFRMGDLMQRVLAVHTDDTRVRIYDGDKAALGEHLLYDSARHDPGALAFNPALMKTRTIEVAGRTWTLLVTSLPLYESAVDHKAERLIAGTGVAISLLLFALARALAYTRERALGLAHRFTRELEEERRRLREITDTVGDGLYVLDMNGRVTFANPAAAELLGYELDKLRGVRGTRLLSPGSPQHVDKSAVSAPRPIDLELQYQRRDGTTFPGHAIYAPILREGQFCGAVVAFHDLTERKRTEQALRTSEQFHALFEYSSDALFLIGPDAHIMDANRVAIERLGYSRDELLTLSPAAFLRTSDMPHSDAQVAAFFDYVRHRPGFTVETEFTRKSGQTNPMEVAFTLIAHGDTEMLLAAARDITQRKEAEKQIQKAMEQLEQSRREVEAINRRLAESNRELQRLSRRDGLTGIANRRHFDEYLEVEWHRAERDSRPLSLLIADVDLFKAFNDRYGHQAGDECLRRVAHAMDSQLARSIDLAARYGGEEFSVVLPETPLPGAVNIAERMRAAVLALKMPHEDSDVNDYVSISIGVATAVPRAGQSVDALLKAADNALYEAKRRGRNRVCTGPRLNA